MTDALHQYNTEHSVRPHLNSFVTEETPRQQTLNDPNDPCAGLHPSFEPFKKVAAQISRHITTTVSNPISILGISSPIFFAPRHRACLRSLVAETGLHGSVGYYQISSVLATAAANRIGQCACPYSMADAGCDNTRATVLSVDYTDMALTIHIFANYFEWQDGGMFFAREPTTDRDDIAGPFWHSVMDTLKVILAETEDNRIDRIVLSGTLANDSNLHHAILWSLGKGCTSPATAAPAQYLSRFDGLDQPMVDPAIAAAQGAAYLAWRSTLRGCMDPCGQRQRLGLPLCFWEFETSPDPLDHVVEELLPVVSI